MSGFESRMAPASELEMKVIDHLNSTGYSAYQFGQAQLLPECRSLLHRFEDGSGRPCLIRWMPDIIALRTNSDGRVWVSLIDAKGGATDTPNYSVEMSAVETAEVFTDRLYTPTFFVFGDRKVMTPREIRQRGRPGPAPKPGSNASGTPYLLVEKRFARRFRDVFPPVQDGDLSQDGDQRQPA